VYLVVLFHAAAQNLPGGFIGVDVFFVLSGYLVTQLLLRDIAEHGAVRFSRFYARRFRRLLPAAFVALVSTAAVFAAVASPPEILDAIPSFKAAFLYSANWYFVYQSANYFGIDPATNPVMHFWSLAVEEQFYLLWPLALAALFAWTKRHAFRQLMTVRVVVTIATLTSLMWALWLTATAPGWAYYGTDARAYQLLGGALIALTPALVAWAGRFRRTMHTVAGVSVVALIAVASPLLDVNAIARGVLATLVTCVLILALEAGQGGIIDRLLSNDFMVYLGKISYGTYLWHWPVLSIATRTLQLSSISTVLVAVIFASALASLSAALLEVPVRESRLLDRHGPIVVAGGLLISILAGLVVIPTVMTPRGAAVPDAHNVATVGTTLNRADLDWRSARWKWSGTFPNCMNRPVERCTIVKGTGRHIFLMGDSHAAAWIPTFREIARREDLTLSISVFPACPWQRDLFRPETVFNKITMRPEDCKKYKDDVYDRVIPGLHPDVVVVTQFAYEDPEQDVPFTGADFRLLEREKRSGVQLGTGEDNRTLPSGLAVGRSRRTGHRTDSGRTAKRARPFELQSPRQRPSKSAATL
jgi:peptidoglycan/LPS O-acetylase OafA/YrhL